MAEEKKPEAENKAPGKAAAPRRTRSTASKAKTDSGIREEDGDLNPWRSERTGRGNPGRAGFG